MAAAPVVPKEPIEELPPQVVEDEEKKRLRASLASKDEENRRLRQAIQRPPAAAPPPPGQVDTEKLKMEFFKDPVGSSVAIARMAAAEVKGQVGAESFDTLMTLARDAARKDDPELFDKYASEIDHLIAACTEQQPQLRTNAAVWRNGANQIYGIHRRDIAGQAAAQGNGESAALHLSGDGPRQPSPRRPAAPKNNPLSADEKEFITGFGLTEDQFRHGQKIKSEEGDGVRGSSSWDEAMTVDSRKQKRFLKKHDTNRAWPHK